MITTENEDDAGMSFGGKYTCIASNGYDEVRAEAELTLPPSGARKLATVLFYCFISNANYYGNIYRIVMLGSSTDTSV